MDTEEGVEVVWNEVIYSQTRKGPHKERKVNNIPNKYIPKAFSNIAHQRNDWSIFYRVWQAWKFVVCWFFFCLFASSIFLCLAPEYREFLWLLAWQSRQSGSCEFKYWIILGGFDAADHLVPYQVCIDGITYKCLYSVLAGNWVAALAYL